MYSIKFGLLLSARELDFTAQIVGGGGIAQLSTLKVNTGDGVMI